MSTVGRGAGATIRLLAFDVPAQGAVRPAVYTAHEHEMPPTTKNSFGSLEIDFRDIVPCSPAQLHI